MEVTITVKNVVLNDEKRWVNGLIHPDIKSSISDIKISCGNTHHLIVSDDIKIRYFNDEQLNIRTFYYFLQCIMNKYLYDVRGFAEIHHFTIEKDGMEYKLNIHRPHYIIDIKYNDSVYTLDTEIDDINKMRRLYIASVLMREYPSTLDYNIIYDHLLTEEYKKTEYTQELSSMLNNTTNIPIILDHNKCLKYIENLLSNIKIRIEDNTYDVSIKAPLPCDLPDIISGYARMP